MRGVELEAEPLSRAPHLYTYELRTRRQFQIPIVNIKSAIRFYTAQLELPQQPARSEQQDTSLRTTVHRYSPHCPHPQVWHSHNILHEPE